MMEAMIKKDKVVSFVYSLYDEQGNLFEYSDLPVSYLHGSGGELFPRIENALDGRKVGDRVEVELPPQEGFGNHDPSLSFTDDLENVPEPLRREGQELEAQNARGEVLKFVVTHIDREKGKLTVDANHPLAGQTVKFVLTVQDIREATPDELANGLPAAPFQMPG